MVGEQLTGGFTNIRRKESNDYCWGNNQRQSLERHPSCCSVCVCIVDIHLEEFPGLTWKVEEVYVCCSNMKLKLKLKRKEKTGALVLLNNGSKLKHKSGTTQTTFQNRRHTAKPLHYNCLGRGEINPCKKNEVQQLRISEDVD